jgi:fumarate reductase subunit D
VRTVCPKGVDPAHAINQNKVTSALDYASGLGGSGGRFGGGAGPGRAGRWEMKRSNEPVIWLLFGAGGMLSALVAPVLVLITGLLVPLGLLSRDVMSYQRVLAFAQNPLGKLVLLAVISLFLFHGVHRFVTTLNDYGLRGGHATMALFVGVAALLTVVTAGLLLGIGF